MNIAVIGAGAFGGWTALHLLRSGATVTLIDAWGPGNSRASSGGESRIIRSVYGNDEASTKLAIRALQLWKEHEQRWQTRLYHPCGALFLAEENDEFFATSCRVLRSYNVPVHELSPSEAGRKFPQINFEDIGAVLFEPDAGLLSARENCRTVLKHFVAEGGTFRLASVSTTGRAGLRLSDGSTLTADAYVFACGPWMGKLFPDVIGPRLRPSKQDVLFLGVPRGDARFDLLSFPCWGDRTSEDKFYGLPNFQHRGFKIASDLRGRDFDPDTEPRVIDTQSWERARKYVAHRFPALADAPLSETRVCQYENTPDLAFFLDRHPEAPNMFLLGGGSGHGYKHGPAIGEYVASLVMDDRPTDASFSLKNLSRSGPPRLSSL